MRNAKNFLEQHDLTVSQIIEMQSKETRTETEENEIASYISAIESDIAEYECESTRLLDDDAQRAKNARQAKEERLRSFLMKCKGGGE